MMHLLKNHLTEVHGKWGSRIRKTYPGMAAWAGGTPGKTCSECSFFLKDKKYPHHPGSCQKAISLGIQSINSIPKETDACRYFEVIIKNEEFPKNLQEKMF